MKRARRRRDPHEKDPQVDEGRGDQASHSRLGAMGSAGGDLPKSWVLADVDSRDHALGWSDGRPTSD